MNKWIAGTSLVVAGVGLGTPVQAQEATTAQTLPEAKERLEKGNQAVADQTAIVDQRKAEEKAAEKAVSDLQAAVSSAKELVEQATPEGIAKAENNIKAIESSMADSTEAITQAEQQVTHDQANVDEQFEVVNKATETVQQAKSDLAEAQKAVDQAQAILDGTGQASVIAEAQNAQKAHDQAEQDRDQARIALEQAKAADANRQMAIDKARQEELEKQERSAEKQTALNQAQELANQTQSALRAAEGERDEAQERVSGLKDEMANQNTIVLPAGYMDALTQKSASLTTLGKSALTSHSYKSNAKDRAISISDVNALTQEQQVELTQFTVDLLNQVRQQAGTMEVMANTSAMAFADQVAKRSKTLGHDTEVIPEVAAQFGLRSRKGINEYENFSSGFFDPTRKVTMATLKKAIYDSVVSMLFDDASSNWGHTTSLLGLRHLDGTSADSRYLGVDVSHLVYTLPSGASSSLGRVHILGVSDRSIVDSAAFDTTANLSARNLEAELAQAEQVLAQKQATVDQATQAHDEAQQALTLAQTTFGSAQADLKSAQQTLATAQAVLVQTPAAENRLSTTEDTLEQATQRLAKAKEALELLSADVKEKETALAKAKAIRDDKQAILNGLHQELDQEVAVLEHLKEILQASQDKLKVLKQAHLQKEEQLKQAKEYLSNLNHAPEILAEKEALLAEAQQELASQKQQLLETEELLERLLLEQATLQDRYNNLLQAQLANSTTVPIVNAKGEIVGVSYAGTQNPQAKGKASSLPQTGAVDHSEMTLAGLSLFLPLLALLGYRKKETN
ncbi:SEC10/PgrA surface exclusion domain-containing protein [Streptococcus merionis]|uniref:SEC10/PgrA surface exclusion domain-containing protein n=1 Tax=Streptococcus merionis TaxID=400065 RepID=UPI0035161DBD